MDFSGIQRTIWKKADGKGEDIIVEHSSAPADGSERDGMKVVHLGYALRHHNRDGQFSVYEVDIRERATAYIQFLERFNAFLNADLVDADEVISFLSYHIRLLNGLLPHATGFLPGFYEYLVTYGYDAGLAFLARYNQTSFVKKCIAEARFLKAHLDGTANATPSGGNTR